MSSMVSYWDDGYHTLPADADSEVRVSYADLYGLVLVKRIVDTADDCMCFCTMTATIDQDTHPYDLAGGVLPSHSGWRVLSSSTRLKTAEETVRFGGGK